MDELLRPDDPKLLETVQEYISGGLEGKEDASKPDWTALHWFAAANDSDPVRAQAWVAAGGDPSAQTDNGDTPLHITAWRGNIRKSNFLLKLGASPNVPNNKGHTPLHQALRKGSAWLVVDLACAGGDWGIQDEDGMSGLSHAIDFLKKHLRNIPSGETAFPEGSHEARLIDILIEQPADLWDRPFSFKSPYVRVRHLLRDEPGLAALASHLLSVQMDREFPEESPSTSRRPASRF